MRSLATSLLLLALAGWPVSASPGETDYILMTREEQGRVQKVLDEAGDLIDLQRAEIQHLKERLGNECIGTLSL